MNKLGGKQIIKVGYTFNKENIIKLRQNCDMIFLLDPTRHNLESLTSLLVSNKTNRLYFVNPGELNLEIIHWQEIAELIKTEKISFHFIEKPERLKSVDYLQILADLAMSQKKITTPYKGEKRTLPPKDINLLGRPSLGQKKIDKIIDLYVSQKLSMREVAMRCNVSLGSVSKYVKFYLEAD